MSKLPEISDGLGTSVRPVGADKVLTISDYVAITEADDDLRAELFDGVLVGMTSERIVHSRTKFLIGIELERAIRDAAVPCTTYVDGPGVAINDRDVFIPDVVVQCGTAPDNNSRFADAPTIVVEVLSPSSRRRDLVRKLLGYFRVPTVAHYLMVDPDAREIDHHFRDEQGITVIIYTEGSLRLDPPGLTLEIAACFA